MDDGHENVALQWEGPHGAGAKYIFLGRERLRQKDRCVIRPGGRHIKSLLNVLGMVGCKPVVTPAVGSVVEPDDIERLKGEDVAKYKKAFGHRDVSRDGQGRHHVHREGGGEVARRATRGAHARHEEVGEVLGRNI